MSLFNDNYEKEYSNIVLTKKVECMEKIILGLIEYIQKRDKVELRYMVVPKGDDSEIVFNVYPKDSTSGIPQNPL